MKQNRNVSVGWHEPCLRLSVTRHIQLAILNATLVILMKCVRRQLTALLAAKKGNVTTVDSNSSVCDMLHNTPTRHHAATLNPLPITNNTGSPAAVVLSPARQHLKPKNSEWNHLFLLPFAFPLQDDLFYFPWHRRAVHVGQTEKSHRFQNANKRWKQCCCRCGKSQQQVVYNFCSQHATSDGAERQ